MARNQKLSDLLPPELRQSQAIEPEMEEVEDVEEFEEDEEVEPELTPDPEFDSEPEQASEPEPMTAAPPEEPALGEPAMFHLGPGYSMQDGTIYFGPQTNWQLLWSAVNGKESNMLEGLEVPGLGVLVRSTSSVRGGVTQSITMIPGVRIVELWVAKVGEKEKVFCRKLKKV